MPKVLRGGAIGPDGKHVPAGESPSDDWPQWFFDDLVEHDALVDAPKKTTAAGEKVALSGSSSRGRRTSR